ncbi:Uncharacterised protein [Mycobacteroides abscessus subsp. massiliense]|nr:hypothetical protein [Mycobacteroides abscessus]SKM18428.1 Uncharacterised protein [Mycobacteroides abscessus subsp. massiliense]MDM2426897.1 hypothetical protein [Mycobacteroides abscessus]MDM2431773.1 hypothetical protein [Mycobacteroides abscessus]MDM2436614.1 hypothetical protein [Mycobacteroides abscessus]
MPAKTYDQAWHNRIHAVVHATRRSRVFLGNDFGGRTGDKVVLPDGSNITVDEHLYHQRALSGDDYYLTAEEFADQVLGPQVRALDEVIEGYLGAHPEGAIVLYAPRLQSYTELESKLVTPQGYWVRWTVGKDLWLQPLSTVDILAGAEK